MLWLLSLYWILLRDLIQDPFHFLFLLPPSTAIKCYQLFSQDKYSPTWFLSGSLGHRATMPRVSKNYSKWKCIVFGYFNSYCGIWGFVGQQKDNNTRYLPGARGRNKREQIDKTGSLSKQKNKRILAKIKSFSVPCT